MMQVKRVQVMLQASSIHSAPSAALLMILQSQKVKQTY